MTWATVVIKNHMLFALVLTMTEISGMARATDTGERHRLTWQQISRLVSRSPQPVATLLFMHSVS